MNGTFDGVYKPHQLGWSQERDPSDQQISGTSELPNPFIRPFVLVGVDNRTPDMDTAMSIGLATEWIRLAFAAPPTRVDKIYL
jgi:hypothetical protein